MTASEGLIRYPVLLAIIAIVNIPICFGIATSFFDDGDEIKLMLKNMFLNPYGLVSRQQERDAAWPTAKLLVLLIVLGLLIVSEYSFIADHFPSAGAWAQGLVGARH
jgi:hypothetical protein